MLEIAASCFLKGAPRCAGVFYVPVLASCMNTTSGLVGKGRDPTDYRWWAWSLGSRGSWLGATQARSPSPARRLARNARWMPGCCKGYA